MLYEHASSQAGHGNLFYFAEYSAKVILKLLL